MNFIRCLLCLLLLFGSLNAQKPAGVTAQQTNTNVITDQNEAEALLAGRRQAAVASLNSIADEAKSYRDETLRARVQARVADALWDQDAERARELFRRAWEAAEAVEGQATSDVVASVGGRVSRSSGARPRTNLRLEVLRLAAKRDSTLGENFLARLTAAKDDASRAGDSPGNSPGASSAPNLSPAAAAQRLALASEFLEAGNVERALQFADPALGQVSNRAISFLVALRDKNPVAADQRFASLLARAAADASADANTVSLLTSYAFTPSMYVLVSNTGLPSVMSYPPLSPPNLASALRSAYFRVASGILLRPVAVLDQTSAGRAGTYYIGSRLFPLFQQHAPDLAPLLSAQLTALRPDAQEALNASELTLNRGIVPDDPSSNAIQDELQDRLSRAHNADQRDRAYAFAAMRSADDGDPRARDFVDKIEDTETRNGVRPFVDYGLISGLLRKKNVEDALRLVRKSDLTRTHRIGILRTAAGIVARNDRGRAIALLDEAIEEARRLEAGTPERAYAFVGLLAEFAKLDSARAWQLLSETVKAANGVSGFTGENGQIQIRLEGKFSIQMGVSLASSTDLPEAFGTLAVDDLFHAIGAARDFSGEAPRALATIAAARSVLVQKLAEKLVDAPLDNRAKPVRVPD